MPSLTVLTASRSDPSHAGTGGLTTARSEDPVMNLRSLTTALLIVSVAVAGCSSQGDPGGGSGGVSVTSQVGFESNCTDDRCTVTATLSSSDGTDEAVDVTRYDGENRTALGTVHTFDDPGEQVGESTTCTAQPGEKIAVVLERPDSTELTQIYTVPRSGETGG